SSEPRILRPEAQSRARGSAQAEQHADGEGADLDFVRAVDELAELAVFGLQRPVAREAPGAPDAEHRAPVAAAIEEAGDAGVRVGRGGDAGVDHAELAERGQAGAQRDARDAGEKRPVRAHVAVARGGQARDRAAALRLAEIDPSRLDADALGEHVAGADARAVVLVVAAGERG